MTVLVTVRGDWNWKRDSRVKVQHSLDCAKNLWPESCLVNNGCSLARLYIASRETDLFGSSSESKINQNVTVVVVFTFFIQQSSLSL